MHKYFPVYASNPDIQQVVMMGLWKACLKFDPKRGLKLSTFAYRCMRNELLMYLRKDEYSKQTRNNVTMLSLNAEMEGGDSFLDILGCADFTEDSIRKIDAELLLESLPERQTRILKMRYYEDMSQQQIGDIETCSRSRVSRLITAAKESLLSQEETTSTEQKEDENNDGDNH